MVEHWYEYLPAAWFIPEGRLYVSISLLIIIVVSFLIGYLVGRRKRL